MHPFLPIPHNQPTTTFIQDFPCSRKVQFYIYAYMNPDGMHDSKYPYKSWQLLHNWRTTCIWKGLQGLKVAELHPKIASSLGHIVISYRPWGSKTICRPLMALRLTADLYNNTIQYNTKFVKRHVAVASEALANRSVRKQRRRRTNVL